MENRYLPHESFDRFYDNLIPELREPIIVGGDLVGCIMYGKEHEGYRVIRGRKDQIGNLEWRLIVQDMELGREYLGTGQAARAMHQEFIDEGKVLPRRSVNGERRRVEPLMPIDTTLHHRQSSKEPDNDGRIKTKVRKKSKSRTRKTA